MLMALTVQLRRHKYLALYITVQYTVECVNTVLYMVQREREREAKETNLILQVSFTLGQMKLLYHFSLTVDAFQCALHLILW